MRDKTITASTGKDLLLKVHESGCSPEQLVENLGLVQVSDEAVLREIAAKILSENPEQVQTYKDGKLTVIGWFVGQVMRETKGKANPQKAQAVLEELLSEH